MQQILTFLWWSAGHFPAQCSIKKYLWHIILFIKYVTKRVLNFRNGGQRRFRLHFLLLLIMINISHSLAALVTNFDCISVNWYEGWRPPGAQPAFVK